MNSPTYDLGADLGSLCSSPLLYQEGEDFLGQPVNTFFDGDISFDFIDTFETGFSIAEDANELPTTRYDDNKDLTRQSSSQRERDRSKDKAELNINEDKTFCASAGNNEQVNLPHNESTSGSLHKPISESVNAYTNEVNPSTENLDSRTLCKNAEGVTQYTGRENATEIARALSTSPPADKNRVKTGSQAEKLLNTTAIVHVSPEGLKQNFEENTYINNTHFNEKLTFDNFKPLSLDGRTTCNKDNYALNGKSIKTTHVHCKKTDDASLGLKNSSLKRCVVPKTFYSPFWKPDKSTAKHEKSLIHDSLVNTQRNVDILYCCNYKSQKRDFKIPRLTTNPAPLVNKDGHKYIDFLKRTSVGLNKRQGSHRKVHGKTINAEISGEISNETHNDRWISLPAIYTSSKTPRQKAVTSNRAVGEVYSRTLSVASIDGLIKRYKGKHFDLVEQQKRYQLKPFK